MRRLNIILALFALSSGLSSYAATAFSGDGGVIAMEGSFLRPVQKRDSVLIADQLEYGVSIKGIAEGTGLVFPDYSKVFADSVELVSSWKIDTIRVEKIKKTKHLLYDVEAKILITSFEEGEYLLPQIAVQRIMPDGRVDTLLFKSITMNVHTMPVDTATYKPHDIKGQIKYPVTFKEMLPYIAITIAIFLLVFFAVRLIIHNRKKKYEMMADEPPHIIALRRLDKFRGNKFWTADKQKAFYSGVTDALREYIASRFDFGAMEMTTAEIFRELKGKEISKELYKDIKGLFETADFVKYAKFIVNDEENAKVIPLAVKFVTDTYQKVLNEEAEKQSASVSGGSDKISDNNEEDNSAYMPK